MRNDAKERGYGDMYPSLDQLLWYRQTFCLPSNIVFGPDFVMVPIPDVLHHQLKRRMDYETIQKIIRLIALGYAIYCYYKYGCDSASGYSNYRFLTLEQARAVNQNSLFLSELFIISIVGKKAGCEDEIIFYNYIIS